MCKEEGMKLGRAREPEFLPAVSSFPRAEPGKSSWEEREY